MLQLQTAAWDSRVTVSKAELQSHRVQIKQSAASAGGRRSFKTVMKGVCVRWVRQEAGVAVVSASVYEAKLLMKVWKRKWISPRALWFNQPCCLFVERQRRKATRRKDWRRDGAAPDSNRTKRTHGGKMICKQHTHLTDGRGARTWNTIFSSYLFVNLSWQKKRSGGSLQTIKQEVTNMFSWGRNWTLLCQTSHTLSCESRYILLFVHLVCLHLDLFLLGANSSKFSFF